MNSFLYFLLPGQQGLQEAGRREEGAGADGHEGQVRPLHAGQGLGRRQIDDFTSLYIIPVFQYHRNITSMFNGTVGKLYFGIDTSLK